MVGEDNGTRNLPFPPGFPPFPGFPPIQGAEIPSEPSISGMLEAALRLAGPEEEEKEEEEEEDGGTKGVKVGFGGPGNLSGAGPQVGHSQ